MWQAIVVYVEKLINKVVVNAQGILMIIPVL